MSAPAHRYPVDRYLVESDKPFGQVNILDDDLWNSEPALRPEDEIILRKLQEMLQSTADDLKLLSQEMNKHREPRVLVKTLPMPLDEEFNEKVHIQEVVDAKFHGYKIIDPREKDVQNNLLNNVIKSAINKSDNFNVVDKQINTDTVTKKIPTPKVLRRTKIRTLNIDNVSKNCNQGPIPEKKIEKPTIGYNEYSHNDYHPKESSPIKTSLKIQQMPSINIRSELREQKVLQLDILPEETNIKEVIEQSIKNVAVHAVKHVPATKQPKLTEILAEESKKPPPIQHSIVLNRKPLRKVTKMSVCDSSDSSNTHTSKEKHAYPSVRSTAIPTTRSQINRSPTKSVQRKNKNLEQWKRKLNAVYGHSNKSPKKKPIVSSRKKTVNTDVSVKNTPRSALGQLNNAQYIPYSKLTVGGVRASDIENEIGNISDKGEADMGPIIDKILSSRDQSFNEDKNRNIDSAKVLDTSDEKLLQEVIDIEETVKHTLILSAKSSDRQEQTRPEVPKINVDSVSDSQENYDDDFEDDKSENTENNTESDTPESNKDNNTPSKGKTSSKTAPKNKSQEVQNTTYTKSLNLSFKNSVDVHEFIHSVDTQEIATQSCATHKISLKQTQTSPKDDVENQPAPQIHNDLWPIDPKGEVEKMFKIEKDFIKKLILEEYGDFLESNISKPSTSNDQNVSNQLHTNIISTQKLTQTSPARVKCAMTSPKTTKTRMTSPFALSVTVDRQTSPMEVNTQEELKVELDGSNDDLGISINLSSPRFSLRLPQNSREVFSNLEICSETFICSPKQQKSATEPKPMLSKRFTKSVVSSSSSEELHSSEISSLGEVTLKLRKKLRRNRVPTISESSSCSQRSSSDYQSCGILPLRSEGEISLGQAPRNKVPFESDGEVESKNKRKNK